MIRRRPPAARDRRTGRRDLGITLVETVVSLAVTSIAMVIFTTGVLQVYRFANRGEAVTSARSQVTIAFRHLEHDVGYAAAISSPYRDPATGDHYVEYLVTTETSPACVQLRFRAGADLLERRTWDRSADPIEPTAWLPLATRVTATTPFVLHPVDATYAFQRLEVRLAVAAGAGVDAASAAAAMTFTARNSRLVTSTTTCTEGRNVP